MSKISLDQSFEEFLQRQELPVLAYFRYDYSISHKKIFSFVEKLAKEYKGKLLSVEINIEKNPEIEKTYNLKKSKTILFFEKGKIIQRLTGELNYELIKNEIIKILYINSKEFEIDDKDRNPKKIKTNFNTDYNLQQNNYIKKNNESNKNVSIEYEKSDTTNYINSLKNKKKRQKKVAKLFFVRILAAIIICLLLFSVLNIVVIKYPECICFWESKGDVLHKIVNGEDFINFFYYGRGDIDKAKIIIRLINNGTKPLNIDLDQILLSIVDHDSDGSVVRNLLDWGADPNCCGIPNIAAAYSNVQVIKILIEHEMDLNKKNEDGHTSLYTAINKSRNNIVKLLLNHGANPNCDDVPNIAAAHGNIDVIKLLLENGMDVNHGSESGFTPIIDAIYYSRYDALKLLLSRGADLEIRVAFLSNNKRTPLIMAASDKSVKIIELLLSYGADINAMDEEGRNALDIARQLNRGEKIIEVLSRAFEAQLPSSDLKKYITFSKGPLSVKHREYNYNARWEKDDHGYFYVPASSDTRIDGAKLEFYVTNNLEHIPLSFTLEVAAKTYKKDDGDFYWPSRVFDETITVNNLHPGKSRKMSVFFDSYVAPKPKHALSIVGSFLAAIVSDDAPIRGRQPIDPETIKFKIWNINK